MAEQSSLAPPTSRKHEVGAKLALVRELLDVLDLKRRFAGIPQAMQGKLCVRRIVFDEQNSAMFGMCVHFQAPNWSTVFSENAALTEAGWRLRSSQYEPRVLATSLNWPKSTGLTM